MVSMFVKISVRSKTPLFFRRPTGPICELNLYVDVLTPKQHFRKWPYLEGMGYDEGYDDWYPRKRRNPGINSTQEETTQAQWGPGGVGRGKGVSLIAAEGASPAHP